MSIKNGKLEIVDVEEMEGSAKDAVELREAGRQAELARLRAERDRLAAHFKSVRANALFEAFVFEIGLDPTDPETTWKDIFMSYQQVLEAGAANLHQVRNEEDA